MVCLIESSPAYRVLRYLTSLVDFHNGLVLPCSGFPEFCFSAERILSHAAGLVKDAVSGSIIYLGFAHSGRLYALGDSASAQVLASNVTSFAVASGFAIFTTTAHEAIFVPVAALASDTAISAEGTTKNTAIEWDKRRLERGSRIVAVVPSAMSLILQMPRGNLETISPRPLVMEVVKQDLDA